MNRVGKSSGRLGFTLIELLVVVAIIGISLGAAFHFEMRTATSQIEAVKGYTIAFLGMVGLATFIYWLGRKRHCPHCKGLMIRKETNLKGGAITITSMNHYICSSCRYST